MYVMCVTRIAKKTLRKPYWIITFLQLTENASFPESNPGDPPVDAFRSQRGKPARSNAVAMRSLSAARW